MGRGCPSITVDSALPQFNPARRINDGSPTRGPLAAVGSACTYLVQSCDGNRPAVTANVVVRPFL